MIPRPASDSKLASRSMPPSITQRPDDEQEWRHRVADRPVRPRQVGLSEAEDEDAGDREHVEDRRAEDDVSVEDVIQGRLMQLLPGPAQPATKPGVRRWRGEDHGRAGDGQGDRPAGLREDRVGRASGSSGGRGPASGEEAVAGEGEVGARAGQGVAVERDERRGHHDQRDRHQARIAEQARKKSAATARGEPRSVGAAEAISDIGRTRW